MEHIDRDYQQSLQGKTPHFEAPVPAFLTKEKIIDLLDKSAKSK